MPFLAPPALPLAPPPGVLAPAAGAEGLDRILSEIRALRELQEEILDLLKSRPVARWAPVDEPSEDDAMPSTVPSLRSQHRKTVLLIDDDEADRNVVVETLQKADVPVRIAEDGNAGIAAIAAEKPDVIVLELEIGGPMRGTDVINMIKATMEWVDIPIVLYTRAPIHSQKEARIHGADDHVPKGPHGHEVLASKIVTLFRKG